MTACEQCVKQIQDVFQKVATRTFMEGMDAAISDSTSITIKYGCLSQMKNSIFKL